MKSITLLTFCCLSMVLQAQNTLKGKVVNEAGEPLVYVAIGIIGTQIMTSSKAEGTFELVIPASYHQKELMFQVAGYRTEGFRVDSLLRSGYANITLNENVRELKAVEVKSKMKEVTKVKGNRGLVIGDVKLSMGNYNAYGVLVKSPNQLATLESISFHVQNDSSIRFTVRPFLYAIERDTINYTNNLIPTDQTYTFEAKSGWQKMDLSEFQITPPKEMALGVHWLAIETEAITAMSSMSFVAFGSSTAIEAKDYSSFKVYRGIGAYAIKSAFSYFK